MPFLQFILRGYDRNKFGRSNGTEEEKGTMSRRRGSETESGLVVAEYFSPVSHLVLTVISVLPD